MARATDLPCEVILAVFKQLDHVQSLPSCLLTCRYFYHSYKANPRLAIEILERQVGPALLSYSIAAEEASRSPSPHTPLSTTELLETLHNKPGILVDRLRNYPLTSLVRLGHTHDLVKKYVECCARQAWATINDPCAQPRYQRHSNDQLSLSLTEQFRFYRAFYRVELYLRLFRHDNAHIDEQMDLFFSRHSPWENEQLACVYDWLDDAIAGEFSKAVYCASELTAIGIDYRSPGWFSMARRCWNSQGLDFLNQVEDPTPLGDFRDQVPNPTPRVDRLRLFNPNHDSYVRLPLIQGEGVYSNSYMGSEYVFDYEAADLRTAVDKEDSDEGPFTAFESFFLWGLSEEEWIDKNHHNRLCAYVLWDSARIQKYNMLEFFAEQLRRCVRGGYPQWWDEKQLWEEQLWDGEQWWDEEHWLNVMCNKFEPPVHSELCLCSGSREAVAASKGNGAHTEP